MSRYLILRAASVRALTATLLFACAASQAASPPASQSSASGDCDRACLRQMLDRYMAAVFKHDPGAAALTDDFVSTENTVETHKGEGYWKSVGGYGQLQRRYFDPVNETAAYFGLLKRDGNDQITSVRIRVAGRKVSEAEWIFGAQGPGGRGEANPPGLLKYPPPEGNIPASERTPRFVMISLANDYFQAVTDHDGTWVPNDPRCIRIENGGAVNSTPHPGLCLDGFQKMTQTKDLELRRIPVVDEEAGMVFGTAIYVRQPGNPALDNLVHEYFLVRSGKIAGIWTFYVLSPEGLASDVGLGEQAGRQRALAAVLLELTRAGGSAASA